LPCWQDYLPAFDLLRGNDFPGCDQLNDLLSEELCSGSGHLIRFVPSTGLPEGGYEERVHTTGLVSTRPENWHDLFNALVWFRFPHINSAMNTLHFEAARSHSGGNRGKLRDALTLLDESGVLVYSSRPELLRSIAARRWDEAFQTQQPHRDRTCWASEIQLAVTGHALLEKYLKPYKSMTAQALLICVDTELMNLPRKVQIDKLDKGIAKALLAGRLQSGTRCLSPLPLAGIPGWWPEKKIDENFYADLQVFRLPPADLVATPLLRL
jgi:hypothetical protein